MTGGTGGYHHHVRVPSCRREYKRYKVDGAAAIKNVTYAESGIARIRDFYCTKNNGTTKVSDSERGGPKRRCRRLKSSASFSRRTRAVSVQKGKREKLGGERYVHSLVMAVKNYRDKTSVGPFRYG